MELMNSSYNDIMIMPVKRFYNLMKWKAKLEDEKGKIMKEKSGKVSSGPSSRK